MKRNSLFAWGIRLALLFPLTTSAATYYLDADGGSNTNSGTTAGAAWETLAHASAQTFQPGDQILLQRGDTFVGSGPLWVRRFRSILVQKEGYLERLGRYIERNGLRAGLVEERPWEYRFCSAGAYVDGKDDGLVQEI